MLCFRTLSKQNQPAPASRRRYKPFGMLLLLTLPIALFAQAPSAEFNFKKVGNIRIVADGPVDEQLLLSLIEITPNVDILTTSKVRKSIELLYATGQFTNVLVDAKLVNDRVELTFLLRKIYRISEIDLKGQTGVGSRKIRKRIGLRKLEPYTPEKVLKTREDILDVLRENGYHQASVTDDVVLFRTTKLAAITYVIRAGAPTFVKSLNFAGNPHFTRQELSKTIKTKPGDRFRETVFKKDMERLEQLYDKNGFLEHQINVTKQKIQPPNRADLEVTLLAGKQLKLETKGYDFSESVLREQVPIWSEHNYNDDTLEEGRRNLIRYLQQKGYYDSNATWKKDLAGEQILIEYNITSGAKYHVNQILVSGNKHFSRDKIKDLMKTKESGLIGSSPLVTRVFEADRDRILSAYRQEGFLFAHFRRSDVVRLPEGKLNIELEIDEENQVTVSEIRLKGNTIIPAEDFLDHFRQDVGAPVSEAKIRADSNYMVSLYSDRGYPRMQLENRTVLSRDRTKAIIDYKIDEGDQVFVDRIVLRGNNRTKRSTITENLLFEEEDPFSLRKIIASQSKLYSLNVFDRVELDIPRPDSLQTHQNIFIKFTESKPYTISYGFGYQTFDKLRGIFAISNRNLFGTARSLGVQLRGGFEERRALLSYIDPHLFHGASTTISGFAERGVRPSFTYTGYGVTAIAEKRLSVDPINLAPGEQAPPSRSLFFGYTFQDIDTTGQPSLSPLDRRFLAIHLSAFSSGFLRDARDNPIDPKKGNYFSSDLQYASKLVGSDPDFLKSSTQFQFYSPLHNTVFATSIRVGLARELDGPPDQLPLSQRFFAGGGRTIRGFKLDTAGPLDPITGEPTGGNALFIWNLEYRFPLFGSLGAVVFFDYGNVFELVSEFRFNDMRETTGLGIRYKTRIGPVAVDWGYKLDRRFEPIRESPSEFFISVGHAF